MKTTIGLSSSEKIFSESDTGSVSLPQLHFSFNMLKAVDPSGCVNYNTSVLLFRNATEDLDVFYYDHDR